MTFDVGFTAQLPRVFARTGYKDQFHLVGQWFPKLAVYEPAGMRGRTAGGWNAHQFHANSEFYADFGRFDVEITVPAGYVTGATGKRTAERKNPDGTVTYTYSQADVHDFVWTADPAYVELRRTFSATKDVTPAEYAERRETARPVARRGAAPGRRDHPPAAAAAPAAGGAPLPGGRPRPQVVRPLVWPLSLRHADRRRPRARCRRRRRHGIPHLHHRRHDDVLQPVAARSHPRPRGGDHPRVRSPVLVWPRREQRVRGGLARRGHSTRIRRGRSPNRATAPRGT